MSSRNDLDVAGLVDLIPLLGIINNEPTLNRVSELLTHPNPLVQVSACEILGYFRFSSASAKLLAAFLDGEGNLKRAAAQGLMMSGDITAVDLLLEKALSNTSSPEVTMMIARLIVHMAPKLVMKTIKELPPQSTIRAALIAVAE